MARYITIDNTSPAVPLAEIPDEHYGAVYDDLADRLAQERYHMAHYFAREEGDRLRFYAILLDDSSRKIMITSFAMGYHDEGPLPSLTALRPAMHPFERDITERYGVRFDAMPWDKPLRLPFDRRDRRASVGNYPFYTIEGDSLHEVNVGPIHAGIIEPGAFRFICNGETVLHLEIALGYQHRGLERQFTAADNRLRQAVLAETAAGDTAAANATAFAEAVEKLAGHTPPEGLVRERAAALELERMAMHIADTGALSMDVGYQLGQVACEALRTMTINTTQAWCGNRFAKGLIRPFGTNKPLTAEKTDMIRRNVAEIVRRYDEVRHDIKSSPTLLARYEQCGVVPRSEMLRIGVPALRIISLCFTFAGFNIICSSTFQALGNGVLSMIMSIGRQLVVLLPAAYLLSLTGNVTAVWWAFPIAELFSLTLSALFLKRVYRKEILPMREHA